MNLFSPLEAYILLKYKNVSTKNSVFVNWVSAPIFPHEVFTPAKQGKPIAGSKSGFFLVLERFLLINA